MGQIILITGGSRSGKSAYAQKLAEDLPGPRVFVATCPVLDEELRARVKKHQQARDPSVWRTVEEPIAVASVLRGMTDARVFLVDCLTLWIGNQMHQAEKAGGTLTEEEIAERSRELAAAARQIPGAVIMVASEVGMGIVPDNAAARRFRDLSGRCSQIMADAADAAFLMVCGRPVKIKP